VHREKNWSDEVIRRLKLVADGFRWGLGAQKKTAGRNLRHPRFEALLTDLSARFVKLGPGEIDQEIERSLELVGKFFKGDRCGILEFQSDRKNLPAHSCLVADGLNVSRRTLTSANPLP